MARPEHDHVTRSITLLRVFVVLSALILTGGALVLGRVVTQTLERQSLSDATRSVSQYANGIAGRHVVRGNSIVVTEDAGRLLAQDVESRPEIFSIKVWTADGTLAWTNLEPERIGRQYPLGSHLEETIETGEGEAELEELQADSEHEAEALLGPDQALEVYAPIQAPNGEVVGAYEIYTDPAALQQSVGHGKRTIWLAVGAVFLVLYLALALLVRAASRMLRRQTERLRERSVELAESYRQLEANALEAIETLNATVEARDPYTGGHSQRVQSIAVAVGEELGLDPERLSVLSEAALLHDIGKVAVPDSILTKPAGLSTEEFAVIKTHSAEGARILERLRRLHAVVPVVRHHHERWDGRGYPDGLGGETIPLEAAVVGIADAWDAMTTDRPYRDALDPADALRELVEGRGSQFAPAVVDAFMRALERDASPFGVRERVPVAVAGVPS